jgi:hypothetical protein
VSEWVVRSASELQEKYPGKEFFLKPSGSDRQPVDPNMVPEFNVDGSLIPLWLRDGTKAGRYMCKTEDMTDVGVLVNLENVDALFHPPDGEDVMVLPNDDGEVGEDRTRAKKVTYRKFPLAFTTMAGHIQANQALRFCDSALASINRTVAVRDANGRPQQAVIADSVQMYNYYVHGAFQDARNITFKKGTHTAGLVHERLSGGQKTKSKKMADECGVRLPWERFKAMTAKDKCPMSLRIETTLVVDIELLTPQCRNGR